MTSSLERVNKSIRVPIYYMLFMKIAEPRVIRIMLFTVYCLSFWAGVAILMSLPEKFVQLLGETLVFVFAIFILLGSFTAAIAVLPGVWWLERVGIILLTTSVGMYAIILMFIDATPVAIAFILGLAVTFGMRWVEIRGAQLAPREA